MFNISPVDITLFSTFNDYSSSILPLERIISDSALNYSEYYNWSFGTEYVAGLVYRCQ